MFAGYERTPAQVELKIFLLKLSFINANNFIENKK